MLDAILRATEGERVVACIDARSLTASELGARAVAVAEALERADLSQPPNATLAFDRDRVAFASALLGAWITGRAATLLTDSRREVVTSLALHPSTGALLHDCGIGRGVFVPGLSQRAVQSGSPLRTTVERTGAILSSCGTRPCRVSCGTAGAAPHDLTGFDLHSWTARELELELERLARELKWTGRGLVVTTLTPSSLPGALLGVLLPMATGVPFSSAVPRSPEDIAHTVTLQRARTLITTPTHLSGLRDLPRGALAGLECIVSTWQDLGSDVRRDMENRHGIEILEALGPAEHSNERAAVRLLRETLIGVAGVVDAEVVRGPDGLLALVQARASDPRVLLEELRARGIAPPSELRIVAHIERDHDGAVRPEDVLRSFDLDRHGRPIRLDFDWSQASASEPGSALVHVPEDSAWFEGHFPGRPLLAGAVQLQELVLTAFRRALPESTIITAWSGLKFLAPIHPGDSLTIVLDIDAVHGTADFVVRRDADRCSLGRIRFHTDRDALAPPPELDP